MEALSDWGQVSRRMVAAHDNYVRLADTGEFMPEQRLRQVHEHLEEIMPGWKHSSTLPIGDPRAQIKATRDRVFQLVLEGVGVLVSVPNKGHAIMLDVLDKLEVQCPHISLGNVKKKDIYKKDILVFDDTIHEGERIQEVVGELMAHKPRSISVLVIWGSKKGLKVAQKALGPDIQIEGNFISEELFPIIFQLQISPLIYALAVGAVAHRPSKTLHIQSGQGDSLEDLAVEVLSTVCGLDCIDVLEENAAQDGRRSPTYHAAVTFAEDFLAECVAAQGLGALKAEMDQARLFLEPFEQGVRAKLSGILWPEPSDCGATVPGGIAASEADNQLSRELCRRLGEQIAARLRDRGYDVEEN